MLQQQGAQAFEAGSEEMTFKGLKEIQEAQDEIIQFSKLCLILSDYYLIISAVDLLLFLSRPIAIY